MSKPANIIPAERIADSIYLIRGQRVMLSPHLSKLYGVEARALVQSVKRNKGRFPADFMFQLTRDEFRKLKSQIVTLGRSPRATPYAFTEHGVAMLSAVLNSKRAVEVSILIVRAFVRLRRILAGDAALARKVGRLERESAQHGANIEALFEALRALMDESAAESDKPRIGYETEANEGQ